MDIEKIPPSNHATIGQSLLFHSQPPHASKWWESEKDFPDPMHLHAEKGEGSNLRTSEFGAENA